LTGQAEQFNQRNIDEFRTSHGRVGGTFAGPPLLLLHTVGARSGQQRVNPVMYLADGDNYLVFASKAGSDSNPDWYQQKTSRTIPVIALTRRDDPGDRVSPD
jgi:hypothetical protein